MNDYETFLDIERPDNNYKKFVKYWRFEILLTKGIYWVHGISLLSIFSLVSGHGGFVFLAFIIVALSHFFLGCWQLINGCIFYFIDSNNRNMRRRYLLYAFGTLIFMCLIMLFAIKIEDIFSFIWMLFILVNILVLPYIVSSYYIKMLKESIALAEA